MMEHALIYSEGQLAMLHNMENQAFTEGNKRLVAALRVAISEYISHGLTCVSTNRMRKRAIADYRKACVL